MCIGEQFHLSCQHPDLGNASVYPLGSPDWRVDGSVLTPDGHLYATNFPSRTETVLSVSAAMVQFENISNINYTCSIIEVIPGVSLGHLIISSNIINIHPLGKMTYIL